MPSTIARLLLGIYGLVISPFLHLLVGPGFGCRFSPTCSEYMSENIGQFGLIKGLILGLKRLSKCHPFGSLHER